MSKRTIRSSLLLVVFIALIPVAGVAIWQVAIALDDSRDLVTSKLRASAWEIAESERDPFIIARHSLAMISQQPDVRDMGPRCNDLLKDALQGAQGITNIARVDAMGRARCSVLPFNQGHDLTGNAWWKARKGRTTLYLAQPEMGAISREPVLVMVQPMTDAAGRFIGTVNAGVSVDQLETSLRTKAGTGPGKIFVTNGAGRPLISTDGVTIKTFESVQRARLRRYMTTASDGSIWTFVSAPLFGNELYIVYAEPAWITTRTALERIWPSLLLPLLALALASIAIWIAAQRLIVQWLERLQRLTARFARGDFRGELPDYANAPAELAEFAVDLHAMARDFDAQERDLRAAIAAKTALTKEVNHRVKNNLQIVTSLLTLQADRMEDSAARNALSQAKARIAALGLIHRLLYEEDNGAEPGQVQLDRLLTGVCKQLRHTYRDRSEVDLDCDGVDMSVSVDKAVPVALFTVEAVTNAFQHAFPDGQTGQIEVDYRAFDGIIELRVADNGQGFGGNASTGRMGIDLINAFAQQLEGTVDIASHHIGAVWTLRFDA